MTSYHYRGKNNIRRRITILCLIGVVVIGGGIITYQLKHLPIKADYPNGKDFFVAPTDPTIDPCGVRSNADITTATKALPTTLYTATSTKSDWRKFHFWYGATAADDRLYALSGATGENIITIYNATTLAESSHFSFSFSGRDLGKTATSFTVDPEGNVYFVGQLTGFYKVSQTGGPIWHQQSTPTPQMYSTIYGYLDSANKFYVGAARLGPATAPHETVSMVYRSDGTPMADNKINLTNIGSGDPVQVRGVDRVPGDIVIGGFMLRVYNKDSTFTLDGKPKFEMGTDLAPNDSGPFHFYLPVGGIEKADGSTYSVLDTKWGIMSFTNSGILRGMAKGNPAKFGGQMGTIKGVGMEQYRDKIYYVTQDTGVPLLTWTTPEIIEAVVTSPQGDTSHLGIGAGVYTTATGNYFLDGKNPDGTDADLKLAFYPWWSQMSSSFQVKYTIKSIAQTVNHANVQEIPLTIPTGMTVKKDVSIPITNRDPGYYQMSTKLYQGGIVVGAECTNFSIGAPGMPPVLGQIPTIEQAKYAVPYTVTTVVAGKTSTATYSAQPDPELIAAAQFGFKLMRLPGKYTLGSLLPPATLTKPALPYDFDSNPIIPPTDPIVLSPALKATLKADIDFARDNDITLDLQIATGTLSEKGFVDNFEKQKANNTWKDRVSELVGLYQAIGIHTFEAWNEPNNGHYFPGQGADKFTKNALVPFEDAVKGADSTATVVCGGISGITEGVGGYFDIMGQNGAFNKCDAIGFHPYTGHNRSFEEQDSIEAINTLKATLSKYTWKDNKTADKIPLWDTESGFWNSGPNSFYGQGDKLIRKVVLENSIGITNYANYFNVGGYKVDNLYWSLIPNPGGLAMANYAVRMEGLTYETEVVKGKIQNKVVETGIPHTHAALYGVDGGISGRQVMVIWAEDFTTNTKVTIPGSNTATLYDEFGKATAKTLDNGKFDLTISGSPQFIDIPAGSVPTVAAAEAFGSSGSINDLVTSVAGVTASASSNYLTTTPDRVIDGKANAQNLGNITDGMSVWAQAKTDSAPWLAIHFPTSQKIDRVLVASQGIASVETGLRSFDVEARNGANGPWQLVASVKDRFMENMHLLKFDDTTVTDIRITNMRINYTGYSYGLNPPNTFRVNDPPGQATIYEVEAYAPGAIQPPIACVRNAPTIAVSPMTASVTLGNSVNYSVTITNKDTSSCSSIPITLSTPGLPSLDVPTFSSIAAVSPGATATSTLTVKAGNSLSPVNFSVSALNTVGGSTGTSGSIKLEVKPVVTPTPAPTPTPTSISQSISLQANKTFVASNQEITYSLTYKNISTAPEATIKISVPIPTGVHYVENSATKGGVISNTALTWAIPTLPAGESFSAEFKVKTD